MADWKKCVNEDCQYFRENGKCHEVCKYSKIKRIITNADRIRSMSDEELAEFLDDGVPSCTDYCPDFKAGCAFGCKHKQGKEFLVCWLQSEAE